MREMALFYAAYTKKGDDGFYHIIPSMEPEKWGWYGELARNKDVISSLCMFRWALNRTADASEVLGVDEELRGAWREIAENIVPYPTWEGPDGPMYCAIAGVEPKHVPGDHFGEAAEYPTILADEINLDSPKEQKKIMLRTARKLSNAGTTGQTLILLGVLAESMWDSFDAETLLNSRSGRMHLFPAVAPNTDIAFRNFQARGGFLVSAARNAERVYFLEVQARRDNACRIMNPWPGKAVTVHEVGKSEPVAVKVDKSNGECLIFAASAGKKYSIEANAASPETAFGDPEKIDVLVVTGGHGFDREPFFTLFDGCDDINYFEHQLKDDSEVLEDVGNWDYDVVMLYNMTQNISQKRQDNFVGLLKDRGVGLVVVHHAEAAFQSWLEYHQIIGTAYIYFDVEIDGKLWPHCKCKGGEDIPVTVRDDKHPITRGMKDFLIHDETYKGRWWAKDNHILLTTDHPENDEPVAWTRQYGRSRIFNIQFGHDKQAYACPEYRDLIVRSICWTAGAIE
ncbi:MAG: ThuA domain-containing protein [Candidatus Omnitrophota bacterium]|nr:MAG: ThuA domain-containing protein [Candidatus Omnitrophota bacterium]